MPVLGELIPPGEVFASQGPLDVPVTGVCTDSRELKPGNIFVCLPGYRTPGGETRADRHAFIPDVLEHGAAALVVDREVNVLAGVSVVRVRDCRTAAAKIAARYYRHPSREMIVAGITGTSGKTSTSYILESVLKAAGHRVARIGTIEYSLGGRVRPAVQTTPEAVLLQALLREARDAGCTAAVLEVSSHALALQRVAAVDFDCAVFTNLSQDHLNFHEDLEEYAAAKRLLFTHLDDTSGDPAGVINLDDPQAPEFLAATRGRRLTYGLHAAADVRASGVHCRLDGTDFTLHACGRSSALHVRHPGAYSVSNSLAAVAAGLSLGIDIEVIGRGVGQAKPVPGRFEVIESDAPFSVIVDYAHKPGALARLLDSARRLEPRRIITVVGCGGDRDRGKRPIMGRVAAEGSDYVVITSDNPRGESPDAIIADILSGVRATDPDGTRHRVESDRARAIRVAVALARPGDLVIIAGKGHETYQIVGGRRLSFDDREQARLALAALG